MPRKTGPTRIASQPEHGQPKFFGNVGMGKGQGCKLRKSLHQKGLVGVRKGRSKIGNCLTAAHTAESVPRIFWAHSESSSAHVTYVDSQRPGGRVVDVFQNLRLNIQCVH